jgi:3-oxoacyl-[acyl-carrier protein] reductase
MSATITGGTKGIGRAAALRLAEPGVGLALNYLHDDDAAIDTVSAAGRGSACVLATQAGAASLESVGELAARAGKGLGSLDLEISARCNPTARRLTVHDVADVEVPMGPSGAAMIRGELVHVDGGLGLVS